MCTVCTLHTVTVRISKHWQMTNNKKAMQPIRYFTTEQSNNSLQVRNVWCHNYHKYSLKITPVESIDTVHLIVRIQASQKQYLFTQSYCIWVCLYCKELQFSSDLEAVNKIQYRGVILLTVSHYQYLPLLHKGTTKDTLWLQCQTHPGFGFMPTTTTVCAPCCFVLQKKSRVRSQERKPPQQQGNASASSYRPRWAATSQLSNSWSVSQMITFMTEILITIKIYIKENNNNNMNCFNVEIECRHALKKSTLFQ